jgi:hypothetical protein
MTHDEERLERYMEWRRAENRARAARRRRVIGYVAAPALCVMAVGLAAWLGHTSRQPNTTATVPLTSQAPASDVAPSATVPAPVVELPASPRPPLRRPEQLPETRARSRPAPSNGTPPRPSDVAGPSAPAERDGDSPDLSASVAPLPASPPLSAPAKAPPELRDESGAIETPSVPAAPAPTDVAAPPAPAREDVAPGPPPSGGAVAVAPPTVRERVTSWAKGEVQEFRDGVKRELGEFRSGYEKVRGFFKR